ncbi:MAG: exodeoxyribonuclease VII large subunit [Arenicella sp.]
MNTSSPKNHSQPIYQVSELVGEIRQLLEASYRECWIEAEISSLSKPASGHLYFSLKDDSAQVRCAMFRNRASIMSYQPKEGDLVRVRARVSVYAPRGDMQVIVQHIAPAGEGVLKKRFEELKQKLTQEGLFDQSRKQLIPSLPKRIGLITSPSGAAITDVLTTLQRRFSGIPVSVYPSLVQGDSAAEQLVAAIKLAQTDQRCDVLLVTRGGGSLEDLWCFNDENLARAIAACPIPIVSAVGHEVDVSICDFAADVRAATPTAAAELVTPDQEHFLQQLSSWSQRLQQAQHKTLQQLAQQTDWLAARLTHPKQTLLERKKRLNELGLRLKQIKTHRLSIEQQQLRHLEQRLRARLPQQQIRAWQQGIARMSTSLHQQTQLLLNNRQNQLTQLSNHLNAVSPLATLDRGYAIAATSPHMDTVIKNAQNIKPQDKLYIKLSKGAATCLVQDIHGDD